ncbi:hypothetical protein [Vibrio vulnificus YJ016]|uniref:Uncharacterized protein n=1 Tax=Vibrio vulnificus (strain YJ016) TaxID=196600 RepID=Q7MD56_VIBVY|nr:hypothetical protein [Vibrio vulnificus YJ016]
MPLLTIVAPTLVYMEPISPFAYAAAGSVVTNARVIKESFFIIDTAFVVHLPSGKSVPCLFLNTLLSKKQSAFHTKSLGGLTKK